MHEITFTLQTPSGMSVDASVPSDLTIQEFIDDVIIQLQLPVTDDFDAPRKYSLYSMTLGYEISKEATFISAKVPPHDILVLQESFSAGGEKKSENAVEVAVNSGKTQHPVKLSFPSIGLQLDDLSPVDVRNLLSNESALMMTLHSYKSSLSQLEDYRQELKDTEEEIKHLNDRLKEKNIATVLLILGQIQIGFGTNLITNSATGGWFVFLSGLALNLGALYFSFFGLKRINNK